MSTPASEYTINAKLRVFIAKKNHLKSFKTEFKKYTKIPNPTQNCQDGNGTACPGCSRGNSSQPPVRVQLEVGESHRGHPWVSHTLCSIPSGGVWAIPAPRGCLGELQLKFRMILLGAGGELGLNPSQSWLSPTETWERLRGG